jgi:hypothetical protein
MDIRTKLVFALVAVALVSMVALGAFLYPTAEQLRKDRREQLETLAESIRENLEQIEVGWRDRIRLISSRTALRETLGAGGLAGNREGRARVERILADARNAEPSVESLAIYDAEGRFVGSAGWGTESDLQERLDSRLTSEDEVVYQGVHALENGGFRIAYAAALTSDGTADGELVGILHARLNPDPLFALIKARERLGASGEVRIAIRATDGIVRVPSGP